MYQCPKWETHTLLIPLPKYFRHPFLIPEKYVRDQQLPPTFDFLKLMEVETSLEISYYPHKENVANF
jgi:hypothetical protein